MKIQSLFSTLVFVFILLDEFTQSLEENFKNPPNQYKSMPFWYINDLMTMEGIPRRMKGAHGVGFFGVSLLPLVPVRLGGFSSED